MLDIKLIRENPERVKKALESRSNAFPLDDLLQKDGLYRKKMVELEEIRHQKRVVSDQVGELKRKGEAADRQLSDVRSLSEKEKTLSVEVADFEKQINDQLLLIPNIPQES